ncbi:BA75_02564T0 [Komagataella pastoris]|uniref:Acyl carrier protein n=1 Tax=Komagataella pastoris TaxID=4922 RepID=A0A1B2JDM5_PICPA|nr:BA75_02564T0 [Komagataella pastoris]
MLRNVSRQLLRSSKVYLPQVAVVRTQTPAFISPSIISKRFNITQSASTLTKEDVLTRSVSVLRGFEVKTKDIDLQTTFVQDLGMDSLDLNDALVALEEEFDVVFDDKTANEIKTVGEVVDFVLANYLPTEQSINHTIR